MIGFFIKKWFFDLWDNLLVALAANICLVLPLSGLLLLPGLFVEISPLISAAVWFIMFLVCFIAAGVVNRMSLDFVKSAGFSFGKLPEYFKASWLPSLVLGAIFFGLGMFLRIGVPFYNDLNPILGFIITILAIWAGFFITLAAQWYWPLNAQFEPKIKKLFKKSFILLFDNAGFSLFLIMGAIVITALSIFTLSLFPGVMGLVLWFQVSLKLRMYKYDYLETVDPNEPRSKVKIPWDSLLAAEKEQIGPRSLKGMFFPWKD